MPLPKTEPKPSAKHRVPETRASRGIRLFRERGDEIVRLPNGTYRVPSCSGEAVYTVDLAHERCSCPDRTPEGESCKHLVAATVFEAKRSCRRQRRRVPGTAGAPQDRRHGSPRETREGHRGNRSDDGRYSDTPARRHGCPGDSLRGILASLDGLSRMGA
jgi:hypothetical protein